MANATEDKKEQEEHIQHVTQQNATLINMIHEQQKKVDDLMTTSKVLISKMRNTADSGEQWQQNGDTMTKQGKKKSCAATAKAVYTTTATSVTHWKRTKKNHPPWYNTHFNPDGTRKGGNQT